LLPFCFFEMPNRCLVSPKIGCAAHCSYCYLNEIGETDHRKEDKDVLLERIISDPRYKEGRYGTVVSLGCFTECLSESIRDDSLFLLKYFIKKNNKVSIATKLDPSILIPALKDYIQYNDQINIFISCPTISKWTEYETGTIAPTLRLNSIPFLQDVHFNCFLYIKPFLGEATLCDLQIFKCYIEKYHLTTILGKKFSLSPGESAPIAGDRLHVVEDPRYYSFKIALSEYGEIYERSIDVL